jgi:hypothetical protein
MYILSMYLFIVFIKKMELTTHFSLNDLHIDLLLLIIIKCSDLSKFILHFVSKKLQNLTMSNKKNYDAGISFVPFYKKRNVSLCIYKKKLCVLAASAGSLSILKWLYVNNYECNEFICSAAAKKIINFFLAHLEVIKWARENNCPPLSEAAKKLQ